MFSCDPIGNLVWTLITNVHGEVCHPEGLIIFVIRMHQTFSIAPRTECGVEGGTARFDTLTRLHATPGMQGCQTVCWYPIFNIAP